MRLDRRRLGRRVHLGQLAGQAWLLTALALSMLFAFRTMAPAYQAGLFNPSVVQDDARQFIFWMVSFRDPELFRGDLIAEYFRSLTPAGLYALYWLLSWVVEPLVASKLLPPLLGLVAAFFTFLAVRRLHPSPACALLATVFSSWYAWQQDSLASASPRAFFLPLLAVMLWAVVAGRRWLSVGVVALGALLYPSAAVMLVGLLGMQLLRRNGWRLALSRQPSDWAIVAAAALVAVVVLLPGQLDVARFGPTVSVEEAREMAEFGQRGRAPFFETSPYNYWLADENSGLDLRVKSGLLRGVPLLVELALLASLLPLLWMLRRWVSSVGQIDPRVAVVFQLLVVSLVLWGLAHVLLFRLYWPSRFVVFSVPLALSIMAGLALGIVIEQLGGRLASRHRGLVVAGLALVLGLGLAVYPAKYYAAFASDARPAISAYLRAQPTDALIAGPSSYVNSIPIFAGRSILTAREFALPFHLGYYEQIRRRTNALISAYYARSPAEIRAFASRYGVSFFIVNLAAFDGSGGHDLWSGWDAGRWYPFFATITRETRGSRAFAMPRVAATCAAVVEGHIALVPADCFRENQ